MENNFRLMKNIFLLKKFGLIFRKVFFFYFEQKIFFRSYEKFKNIILFDDYVKFDSQTFDCYIFFFIFFFKFIP